MSARSEAVWRLLGLVYLVTIFPLVALIGSVAALVYMLVDVVLQLLTGGEGLTTGSGRASWLSRLYEWGIAQAEYIFFGTGSFQFLP